MQYDFAILSRSAGQRSECGTVGILRPPVPENNRTGLTVALHYRTGPWISGVGMVLSSPFDLPVLRDIIRSHRRCYRPRHRIPRGCPGLIHVVPRRKGDNVADKGHESLP